MTTAKQPFTLIKDFKNNDVLRASFNALTQRTYGFDFENWYQQGYWPSNYIPYAFAFNNQVIANVSVNCIDFLFEGNLYKLLQIGTVMTDPAYRQQGLSAALMNAVLADYEGKVDGIYLFANDSVLNFYPKFGFAQTSETVHAKTIHKPDTPLHMRQLNLNDPADKALLLESLETKVPNAVVSMENYDGLYLFYLINFMTDCLYYIEALNAVAIAESDGDTLHLMDIFCPEVLAPERVGQALMTQETMTLRLGFTPLNGEGYETMLLSADDTTLFIKGLLPFSQAMFPVLSHA